MGFKIIKSKEATGKKPPLKDLYPIEKLEVGECLQIDRSDFPDMTDKQVLFKIAFALRWLNKRTGKKYSQRTTEDHINIFRTA